MNSPFLRQLFVASSPQLAAISVGGVVAFPNVILEQFKANDSSIHLDLDASTWIGSTHGLAGIPSIAIPTIMQWRGRKFSYLLSCLLIIIGWILTYLSKNVTTIIIAECFHGLGINSIIIVSYSSISEMVDPKFRLISMSFYIINETLGITIASIIGRYLHWKTVSIIMSMPIILAFMIGLLWPESPLWLAYKGEYTKCENSFKWLRGTEENQQKELKELLSAHKEHFIANKNTKFTLKKVLLQITSRDFYMPCFQSFIILCSVYWSGNLVVMIYGIDVMQKATNNSLATHYGMIAIYVIIYLGTLSATVLLHFFKNKTIYVTSGFCAGTFMFGASAVALLQSTAVLSNDSLICMYFIVAFMAAESLGLSPLSLTLAAEIMPVKHRGLGGAIYVVLVCSLHSLVLKISPYLMLYIGLWGTFLLFSITELTCVMYVWRYIPETKGRTLQEIEDFYNYGRFVTRNDEGAVEDFRLE